MYWGIYKTCTESCPEFLKVSNKYFADFSMELVCFPGLCRGEDGIQLVPHHEELLVEADEEARERRKRL